MHNTHTHTHAHTHKHAHTRNHPNGQKKRARPLGSGPWLRTCGESHFLPLASALLPPIIFVPIGSAQPRAAGRPAGAVYRRTLRPSSQPTLDAAQLLPGPVDLRHPVTQPAMGPEQQMSREGPRRQGTGLRLHRGRRGAAAAAAGGGCVAEKPRLMDLGGCFWGSTASDHRPHSG
jgi:hypothetical protein